MTRVLHTPQARDGLKAIAQYITEQCGERSIAIRFLVF
jgi:hypothetical protein